ncbi:MAG: flagellar biosynthesis anti-sigma factor FlgM [Burkholderiales bacterium]
MKINGPSDTSRIDSTPRSSQRAADAPAAAVTQPPGIAMRLSTPPGGEFDAARVEEIKQAIRDGAFEVDAEVVADRLIASVHDLFVRTH